MGSDVSVVLHADAAVPEVVAASQRRVQGTAATHNKGIRNDKNKPSSVVERCPVIRVIEANAARRLAGDSSAASIASNADPHPLEQPILLIRSCNELDAFTKSRTYVPVLRALYAYLDRHESNTTPAATPSFSNPVAANRNSEGAARRPVCPIGLVFDRSLSLGTRLASADARAACAQYLKLFWVHLIAALEFVREPDDVAHTRWPSSPAVLASREASTGATAASQPPPPRLSVLYLDLRSNDVEDDSAKWFAASVILRAVRRARPFMLVSARGEAAAGTATAATAAGGGTSSSGGGSNAFMNFYSPDVKADMVWASLQHVLLTDNPHLTSGGATALLEELLASDATRDVLLRQQGFDPKAQRAQAVTEALNSGHVRPRPDAQLLPQLVLVDLDHNHHHDATNSPAKPESSSVPPDPLERSSAAVSTVPSSSVVGAHTAERGMMLAAAAAGGSLPPSPQSNIPEPTARGKATPPVPTQAAERSAAVDNATPGGQQKEPTPLQEPQDAAAQLPAQQQQQQQPLPRRVPPQHTQHIKRAAQKPSLKAAVVAGTPSTANAAEAVPAAPQELQAPSPPPLLSPPHPPPQQRVVKAPQPDPLVSDPAPSHSPEPEFTSPPLSSAPRAMMNGNAVDGPALPQLQRPTTPPVTPPRAAANAETATAASTPAPSPQPREPEPTHSPAELPVAAASASSPPPPPPPPAAVRKAQMPKKKKPQQQQQQQAHVDVAVAPATAKSKSARGGATAVPPKDTTPLLASAPAQSKKQPKRKPLSPAPSPADAAATAAPADSSGAAPPAPSAPTPAAAAAAVAAAPPSARRSSGSSLHSFVKLPGEESATKQQKPQAATPSSAHAARNNAENVEGGKEDKTLPAPSQHQGREAPLISPRPKRATSARKPRSPATSAVTTDQQQQHDGGARKTRSARPQTTTTPPQLSRTSRRGLNGKAVPAQIPLLPLPSRDASPRQRARQAIATAAALDDAPDAVVRGHSARRPRETSPRPHVCCHSPTPPISARWVAAAEDRLPSPAHPAYFHSPVRPDALELDTAHALLAELRSPESEKMGAASHRRPSAPPPLVSPRGRRLAAARRTSSEEATIEVPDHVEQQPREHRDDEPEASAAGEEPWLDHAHPIERSSHVESLPAPPLSRRSGNGYRPYTNCDGGNTPRSGRRRGFDIAALDPPEPQFAAAAAKITPTVWEAGVRKRHASPAQVGAARRTTTPPGSARSRGRGMSGGAYDAVQPRTNSPRQRDNVAAAKAAYEAATLAEVRAKEAQARRAQQRRSSAAFRLLQQQHQLEMEKGASLKVEGEVQSEHGDARRSEEDDANASQSPAPNRPNGGRTPPSPQTPFSNDAEQRQQQQQRGGQAGVSAAPRSLYARRRLSTAEPPHLDPGHTTTSKLRQLTSQRTRRVSEAEAEIKTFYANRATPRRDFRGAAALASMALPQPTRDELTFVQQLQQQANERRHSLSARSGGIAMDQRRGSGAAARVREPEVTDSLDVSNPAWRPSQQRGSARDTPATTRYSSTAPPAKQPWTPAYQHRHGLRSPRNVQNTAASDIDEDDESEAPSLSPWGTADYQGSAPRVDERDGMSPGEVNENGVELVHKALRTQRRAYY